jgi:hypothetical protein
VAAPEVSGGLSEEEGRGPMAEAGCTAEGMGLDDVKDDGASGEELGSDGRRAVLPGSDCRVGVVVEPLVAGPSETLAVAVGSDRVVSTPVETAVVLGAFLFDGFLARTLEAVGSSERLAVTFELLFGVDLLAEGWLS